MKQSVAEQAARTGTVKVVLKVFAMNKHKFRPDNAGNLTAKVPSNYFSLDFPGSKGSHPGYSGILQSIPTVLNSGRFSPQDFKRLTDKATDGLITLSAVGEFIAENTVMDSKSKLADLDITFQSRCQQIVKADVSTLQIVKVGISTAQIWIDQQCVRSEAFWQDRNLLISSIKRLSRKLKFDGIPLPADTDLEKSQEQRWPKKTISQTTDQPLVN